MKRKIVFPVIALSSILLSGCLFGTNSSKLVPTESITTTEETTTEITSAETTTETTAETTVSEETTENTTTSEESSATKGTTKATNKTPTTTKSPSKKPSTTKPKTTTTKAPTKKPVATKAPTKVPTKAPTKKPAPTKAPTPTKKPTPVPEKQYAIVKWKFLITSNDHDEDGNNIKRTFYGEFKSYTKEYGTKSASKYNMCDGSERKAFVKKCDPNFRNYSAYPVKIIERLN